MQQYGILQTNSIETLCTGEVRTEGCVQKKDQSKSKKLCCKGNVLSDEREQVISLTDVCVKLKCKLDQLTTSHINYACQKNSAYIELKIRCHPLLNVFVKSVLLLVTKCSS